MDLIACVTAVSGSFLRLGWYSAGRGQAGRGQAGIPSIEIT